MAVFFSVPGLRKGVHINNTATGISLDYREQGCDIQVESERKGELLRFIKKLSLGEKELSELNKLFSKCGFSPNEIINDLDKLGLMNEFTQKNTDKVMSGEDFYYSRLIPTAHRWQYRLGQSPLYQRMIANAITKNELIGFAMEYYHLVKMAPVLISPALSHVVSEEIRGQLLALFVEEYDHDRMMMDCLAAVGIAESELLMRQPLPATFMANASLGVYARQHYLSFFSALFLFETPSHAFNECFIKVCTEHGLPENFYQPLIKHSDINEGGNHDLITLNLLKHIPLISEEEQNTILVHICSLIEMLHEEDRQIVDFYSKEQDISRVYNY
ncbi:iron-containing redox enzyme family protein [Sodalis sp. RH21]|uniref:iron-containing redox enzyme family protein n=1 Tax=unclassified Sodalis (in: enterobacteria) TaxID=2636512 RepID=UPI0039B43164